MEREYNYVYQKLVEGDSDIVGQIAYSLYKKHKIEYIENFKKSNGGQITENDLKSFNILSSTNESIEAYKTKSEILLNIFLENVLEETLNDIENDLKTDFEGKIKEIIQPLKPTNTRSIFNGFVSSFLFALFIAAMVFIIQYSNKSYTIEIKDSTSKSTPDIKSDKANTTLKNLDSIN